MTNASFVKKKKRRWEKKKKKKRDKHTIAVNYNGKKTMPVMAVTV
jgi:transposase